MLVDVGFTVALRMQKDQLVLLPARSTPKKYLKNKADCPFSFFERALLFCCLCFENEYGPQFASLRTWARSFFFSLLVVCGKVIHNKQLEDCVSLFLFPPCNRQLHGCM